MDAFNDVLTSDLADELSIDLAGEEAATKPAAPDELERMGDFHRGALATYSKRVTTARKHCKEAIAEFDEEKRLLKRQFDADIQQLDAEIAAVKEMTAEEIATAQRLALVSRSALEVLAS